MRLSKHFTLEEMTRSMVAARKGIDNTPGAGEIKNLENVCYEILEPCFARSFTLRNTSWINGVPNIKVAYWLTNNVDFDQCILEFYKPDDGQAGWIHVSYNEKGSNRKQILTFDGKHYENGLPDMKWQGGKVIE